MLCVVTMYYLVLHNYIKHPSLFVFLFVCLSICLFVFCLIDF